MEGNREDLKSYRPLGLGLKLCLIARKWFPTKLPSLKVQFVVLWLVFGVLFVSLILFFHQHDCDQTYQCLPKYNTSFFLDRNAQRKKIRQRFKQPTIDTDRNAKIQKNRPGFKQLTIDTDRNAKIKKIRQGFKQPTIDADRNAKIKKIRRGFKQPTVDTNKNAKVKKIRQGFKQPTINTERNAKIKKIRRGFKRPAIDTDENAEIQKILRSLEQPANDTDFGYIFKGDLLKKTTWEFDFSEISKRQFGRNYVEVTSYDQEGRNLDFFNPYSFSGHSMVVLEDYGPGILKRILLCDPRMATMSINVDMVIIEVDGERLFVNSDRENRPEKIFPFQEPLYRYNLDLFPTGYLITFPIAYQNSIRVIFQLNNGGAFGEEIWSITEYCKRVNTVCAIAGYFDISYNKFAPGTKLKNTFKDYFQLDNPQTKFLKQVSNAFTQMAKAPVEFGPGMKTGCKLTCQKVVPGQEIVIFSAKNSAQVIQSILFRVYDVMDKVVMSNNWKTMLITMSWDGKQPQVKEIPLAGLFTTGWDYLREVRSLNAGLKNMNCNSQGYRVSEMASHDWLAYLFYDMPFWKSAKITIKRISGISPGIICTKITTKPLDFKQYNPRLTGYFSAQLNQQEFGPTHLHPLLRLENQWGNVVAMNFFLRSETFNCTEENDVIIEIDQANVPTISGTGLEDFFDYVHSFYFFRNTSSIFNGAPYVRDTGGRRFIIRSYRHMVLDPILFTTGILIYLEGNADRIGKRIFRETSSKFNQNDITPNSLVTVALYYGSKGNGGIITDKVDYKDLMVKGNSTIPNFRRKCKFNPAKVDWFSVNAMFENQPHLPFDRIVAAMNPGQTVTHIFRISRNNVGVILRREYRTVVPNQKAQVEVDSENAGIWLCQQRALTIKFSLRTNDYHLPPRYTVGKDSVKITLKAITKWETISITVISIVLTDG